jgi:ankyrin repeat protein
VRIPDLVEHLAAKHPGDVKTMGGFYMTPLVAALAGRHFQAARFLHHNGAHLDVRGEEGDTLLHSPAWYGDLEMVQVLLDCKVAVNAQNDSDWAPLHDASDGDRFATTRNVVQSFPDTIQLLLEHGADVNIRGLDDSTRLHRATNNGNAEIVRMLLKHGANVDAKNYKGRTPLQKATENGTGKAVRVLLEHCADVGEKDNEGRTPLHKAAENGSDEAVRVLLERGAKIDAKDDEGQTPLHKAAEYWRDEVVCVLLERGRI